MSNTVIELRHSYISGNVPTSLANGEIAINTYDGKLFYRGGPSNTIQTIERYEGPAGLDTEIQFNDSGILGSSPRLTFDKATGLFRTGNVTANTVVTGNVTVTQNLTVTGNISVSGNLFTSIPANGNTSAYATKYLVEYNPVSREFSYSSTPNASNPYITGYSSEIHVSPVAFNDSGKGTIGDPVKTIARAKELLALAFETTGAGQRKTIILHPGDYAEDVTIDTQFTVLTTHELIGKNTTLTGTLTLATGCTVEGLKMTNLVISATAATGSVDLIGCTVTTSVTKTSSAYTVFRGCDLSSATLSVTGAGNTILIGGNYGSLTVNNASAGVLAKAVITMGPITLTAGTLQIADTIVYSATNSSNAITQSAGSVLTLNNSQILIPTLTNVARVNLGGFYSILHSVYDKANSTLSGTSLNAISYSQYINADKVTLSSGGSLVFPDSTIQITAAAPFAYANAGFLHANSGFIQANSAFIHANSAYNSQNATGQYANAAFIRANNSLDANNGGTATGNISILANLTASNIATQTYIQFGDGTKQYTANAGSGGGGSPLTVSLTDDSNNYTNVVTAVTGIRFDANSGFDVTNLGSGNVKIAMNSTFKTWKIAGQNDLIANGLDTIAFVASNGISITSNTLANPKSITFDGSRIFNHANAAFNAANTGGGSGSDLIKTFNILSDFSAPVPGKAIFVPEATNTIRSVRLTNGGPVDRNLTAGLYKNDILLQYFTLPMGQFTVKYSDLSYAINTTDYIKVSIIEGLGSNFSMTLFNT